MTTPLHPLRRRILADRLVRRRAPDEAQRYAAAQRRGRIDPNPHQIDAVIFALQRIPEGGCVLADEVGLGKTIEAGLVIAQVLAEGAQRILIIVPKPLLGQWRDELWRLFAIDVREVKNDPQSLLGNGVFIVGREWAGGENGSSLLGVAEPFDLAIIDEAHEIFAGIHRRYDKEGFYLEHASQAVMAHRVRDALGPVPKLLLTATPIQNSLLELWGLVRYVDPSGTLLGDKPTFESLFCQTGGRAVVPQHADELKRRVETVVQRTLRRQAQPFLDVPFVARQTRLVEYAMSDAEQQLYDDVTDYLMDPMSLGFDSANRTLLVIGFHRRMASSSRALAASLDTVHDRLVGLLDHTDDTAGADQRWLRNLVGDLDDDVADELYEEHDDSSESGTQDLGAAPDARPRTDEAIRAEAAKVAGFAERARALPADAKAEALLDVVRLVRERERAGEGQGKVVIFTESLVTQSWLHDLLIERGVATTDEVTLFRGDNRSPRASAALARWREEVADTGADDLSTTVATRLALVHEFRTRSAVFIATEAGAKGLNLQFCDTLVNYDLPWNPQRIEQRIGRCHRYGQTRDVTVVNFLAADNEAQRLTFDLLSQKLELFGEVLDASDQVLHSPDADHIHSASLASSVGATLAGELRQIYAKARSRDEVQAELQLLRERFDERRAEFEDTVAQTHDLIETRLDASVHRVFQQLQTDVPEALRALDRQVEQVVCSYLDALGVPWTMQRPDPTCSILQITDGNPLPADAIDRLDDDRPAPVVIGDVRRSGLDEADAEVIELLHLGHPLARAAVRHARGMDASADDVPDRAPTSRGPGATPAELAPVAATVLAADLDGVDPDDIDGAVGRLAWVRVRFDGLYPVEHLALLAAIETPDGPGLLPLTCADGLEAAAFEAASDAPAVDGERAALDAVLTEGLAELEFDLTAELAPRVRARFERLVTQIERYVDDRMLVLRRRRRDLETRLAEAEQRLQSAPGPNARGKAQAAASKARKRLEQTAEALERLATRDDPTYVRWRTQARERRAQAPRAEILVLADVRWSVARAAAVGGELASPNRPSH